MSNQLHELLKRLEDADPTPIGDRVLVEGEVLRSLATENARLRWALEEANEILEVEGYPPFDL